MAIRAREGRWARWLLAALLVTMALASGRFAGVAHAAGGGTAYAWGNNSIGQLGNGTNGTGTDSAVPVAVSNSGQGGLVFTKVGGGKSHSLGLLADGTAYAWGSNQYGQLGAPGQFSNVPVMVPGTGPGGIALVALDGGAEHSIGLAANGTAYIWGNQPLSGGTGSTVTEVAGTGPGGIVLTRITAGDRHSLGVTADGSAYAWGRGEEGQLGNGTSGSGVSSATPVKVTGTGPGGIILVAVAGGNFHSVGITANGTAYAWGRNDQGQLGNNNVPNDSTIPVQIPGTGPSGIAFTAIAAGGYHSLGLTANGTAYGWGFAQYGQVGDGTSGFNAYVPTPKAVTGTGPGGLVLTSIAAGFYLSFGLTADGTGYGWGNNDYGSLGIGTSGGFKTAPTKMAGTGPGGLVLAGLEGGILGGVALVAGAAAPCDGIFADVQAGDAACGAIASLVNRGVIKGYATFPPTFGPNDPVQRAQMAAFLVRALNWQGRPTGPRSFNDLGGLDAELQAAALILANSCDNAGKCVARGTGPGTFSPNDQANYAQVIAFIVRAFGLEPRYAWALQPGAPQPYSGVPTDHDVEVRTYVHYAGAIPDAPTDAAGWNAPASRGWAVRVLYQALQTR